MRNPIEYHQSLSEEIFATKNRLRNLVQHWPTDGEWKEVVLRTVLRRHLPDNVAVGRGFVVGREEESTQIDILVLKPGKPVLFRDGDLFVVSPDAPAAIVEVKTNIGSEAKWKTELTKLCANGKMCHDISGNTPWLGMFSFDDNQHDDDRLLDAAVGAFNETDQRVNCISCNKDTFCRFWPSGEHEHDPTIIKIDDIDDDINQESWRSYHLTDLAPAYFVSNLIDAICNVDKRDTDYTWFPYTKGKKLYMTGERVCPTPDH